MNERYLWKKIDIKYCVKLGKNASDTCAMLSDNYGREDMKNSSVFKWHKSFKEGREDVENDEDNAHHFLRCQGYCSL
jgi:uncharacterized metal-binding protein